MATEARISITAHEVTKIMTALNRATAFKVPHRIVLNDLSDSEWRGTHEFDPDPQSARTTVDYGGVQEDQSLFGYWTDNRNVRRRAVLIPVSEQLCVLQTL